MCVLGFSSAGIILYNVAKTESENEKPSASRRKRSRSRATSTLVSHKLRTYTVASSDPSGEAVEVAVVTSSPTRDMNPTTSSRRACTTMAGHEIISGAGVKTYFATFIPATMPQARRIFAADFILQTLVSLLLELLALEAAFPHYDVNPEVLLMTSHSTVLVARAAIAACPLLATP